MSINLMILNFLLLMPVLIAIDNDKIKIALLIFIFLMLPVLVGICANKFDFVSATQWIFWLLSIFFLKYLKVL